MPYISSFQPSLHEVLPSTTPSYLNRVHLPPFKQYGKGTEVTNRWLRTHNSQLLLQTTVCSNRHCFSDLYLVYVFKVVSATIKARNTIFIFEWKCKTRGMSRIPWNLVMTHSGFTTNSLRIPSLNATANGVTLNTRGFRLRNELVTFVWYSCINGWLLCASFNCDK